MALASGGIPLVAFNGFSSTQPTFAELVLATCNNNSTCDSPALTVADTGDNTNSSFRDIQIVMNGSTAVIAFIEFDSSAGGNALRYVTCTGGTCTSAVTVAANIRDCCMDMTLDSSGNPVFVYHDLSFNRYVAVCDTIATCANPTNELVGTGFADPVIAVNGSNFPYIAYSASDDAALLICDTTTCQLVPVYASGPVADSTLTALTDGTSVVASVQLAITNIGDIGSLLDATLVNPLVDFTVTNLDIVSQTQGTVAIQLDISCTTPLANERLTLQTNEVPPQTYTYSLFCASSTSTTTTKTKTRTVTTDGQTTTVVLGTGGDTSYLSMSVDNPLASAGQTMTYTLVASNPKTIALRDVVIYDVFDELLQDITVVSHTHGVANLRGNTLTVSDFTLQPNESATIIVRATISQFLPVGEVIPNIASLESPDASVHVSNLVLVGAATMNNNGDTVNVLVIPSFLPATGQTPWWRAILIIVMSLGVGTVVYSLGRAIRLLRSR